MGEIRKKEIENFRTNKIQYYQDFISIKKTRYFKRQIKILEKRLRELKKRPLFNKLKIKSEERNLKCLEFQLKEI